MWGGGVWSSVRFFVIKAVSVLYKISAVRCNLLDRQLCIEGVVDLLVEAASGCYFLQRDAAD